MTPFICRNMYWWLLAALSLSVVVPGLSLYEDQAGTTDWYQQYVGQLKFAKYHKSKPRLFVGTAEGMLACLNLRDGSLAWRKAIAPSDQLDAVLVLEKPAVVLTLSESGKYLRAWDSTEGGLKWEASTFHADAPVTGSPASLHIAPGPFAASAALVWSGSTAKAFDLSSDGQLLWQRDLFQASKASVIVDADEKIIVVGLTSGLREAQVAKLSPRDGSIIFQWQINLPRKLSDVSVVDKGHLTFVSGGQDHLCTVQLTEGASVTCIPLSQLGLTLSGPAKLSLLPTRSGLFLSSMSRGVPGAVLLTQGEAGLQLHASFPAVIGASEPIELNAEEEVLGVVEQQGAGVRVKVVDTLTGKVVHEEDAPQVGLAATQGPLPDVSTALLGAYKRKAGTSDGFRLLLSWQGGTLALVQQGQAVWVREESLGSVSQALFLDLPPLSSPLVKAEMRDNPVQIPTLDDQLKMQILSIKVQFKLASEEEAGELLAMRSRLSDKNRPYRDPNGFRKMIVLLTRAGKIHALHSGTGRVLWSRTLDPSAPPPTHLMPWRVFHDVEHPPLLLLLSTGPVALSTVVNGHTGEVVQTDQLPYDVSKVISVHQPLHDGKADQTLLLLVSGSQAGGNLLVHPYPRGETAAAFLASNYTRLFFWMQQGSTLSGYGFAQKSLDAETGGITPTPVWRVELTDPVLALAARDAAEPIHSYVKVLGDRSLKYKYLNPSTVFIATGPSAGSPLEADEGAQPVGPLTFTFLDTVTGRILHRQTVKGGRGPVHAAYAENFVVVQYYNTDTARFEMSVLELYDALPRTFSMRDAILGAGRNDTISSLPPALLEVQSQSYFSRTPMKGLAVTRTLRGITTKQVLLLTGSDQVYAMHKRFLDPRRPMRQKLTAEEQEEQLVPYNPELVLFPTQFATQNKQVANLAGVTVAPAYLESAMHLLAHGTDLFYVRLSPAQAYDSLDPDFSYALLVLVLLAMVAAVVVMQWTTQKAVLKLKWK